MTPRRYDHNQRYRFIGGAKRKALIDECTSLLHDIDEIDRELAELGARRRWLVAELQRRRSAFARPDYHGRGRQPVPDGTVRLPPVEATAEGLWGRRLRAACVAILRRTGELALPELHALIHHHGYYVDNDRPVKALADAMAYECVKGRLVRTARGVYGPAGGAGGDRGRDTSVGGPCHVIDHAPVELAPRAA